MIDEIIVCLDGSSMAETIAPIAQGIATVRAATLTVFRALRNPGEVATEEDYLRAAARRFGAQIRVAVSDDPAQAIIQELEKNPGAMAALTTHGRTALGEAILGSVAHRVLRGAERPIMLYCPLGSLAEAPKKITTLAVALDGSEFAETIIPFAAEMAQSLAARLTLLQDLALKSPLPPLPQHKKQICWKPLTCTDRQRESRKPLAWMPNGRSCMAKPRRLFVATYPACPTLCWR